MNLTFGENNEIIGFEKYYWDRNDNLTNIHFYIFDEIFGDHLLYEKVIMEYDENGNETDYEVFRYNETIQDFVGIERVTRQYDNNDFEILKAR